MSCLFIIAMLIDIILLSNLKGIIINLKKIIIFHNLNK